MALFEYRITAQDGSTQTARAEAQSQEELIDRLIDAGYFVLEIREVAKPRVSLRESLGDLAGGGVSRKETTYFYMQLSTLVGAGVTLVESLDSLAEQCENPRLKSAVLDVRSRISAGATFHEAVSRHPRIFDDFACNMIRAGEAGAGLDDMLQQVAKFAERDSRVRSKVQSAMIYPVMLLLIAAGISLFLVGYVFPRFTKVFARAKTALPMPTVILMHASRFLQDHWMLLLAGTAALGAFAVWLYGTNERVRSACDTLSLRVPVFGALLLKAGVARFTRTLGTLLNGGVPIIRSLEVCENLVGNRVLRSVVVEMKSGVAQGLALHEILRTRRVFPVVVTRIVQTGEKTGTLPKLLLKTADFFDYEVEVAVDGVVSLVEPLLIVTMGLVVGFIAMAMFLPMFEMTSTIR